MPPAALFSFGAASAQKGRRAAHGCVAGQSGSVGTKLLDRKLGATGRREAVARLAASSVSSNGRCPTHPAG
jgi:hypothetical protein